jgi:curved DNA-binding protein CbpA
LEVFLTLFKETKKSHYETLGIEKKATDAEIKRAYFGLVRKYQPDRFPTEFKEIRAAYDVLIDPKQRAEYDAVDDLPNSVRSLFHDAQWEFRYGRIDKAISLYARILKKHPELDKVREHYANTLEANDNYGKASEVWEELCKRQPDNAEYSRRLGECYLERGWNKKAITEARRAVELNPKSVANWCLLIVCSEQDKSIDSMDAMRDLFDRAIEAVKGEKTDECGKIYIYTGAVIFGGSKRQDVSAKHLREILRLVRENGQDGQKEGRTAIKELLRNIPTEGLAAFYPELKELADLLPGVAKERFMNKFDDIRLGFEINNLEKEGFGNIFHDLLWGLNAEITGIEEELERLAMECLLLREKQSYDPQIKRLKREHPDLYALHASFFNEVLRARDPEKLMYQRYKKLNKLKHKAGIIFDDDLDPESLPVRRGTPKIGRNDPCPCGSGKKYKKCCGA